MKNAKIVTMTKELVDTLLAMNTNNRNPKAPVVQRYARDVKAGNWKLTCQGIGVSDTGVLIDGQQRLMAFRDAGYPPVECVLVSGLDMESQKVHDQHAKRSARDMFRLVMDSKVSRMTPAVLNVLSKYEDDLPEIVSHLQGLKTMTIDEMYDLHEVYGSSIELVAGMVKDDTFYPAPVIAAAVYYLYKGVHAYTDIEWFLEKLRTGENITRSMPVFHLRNYILMTKKGVSACGGAAQKERYLKSKKAIKASVDGQEMRVLRV